MALHVIRKCDKVSLKVLDFKLTGAVQFLRKTNHSNDVISNKTPQIIGILYTQICGLKCEKQFLHYQILSYF